MPRQFGSTGEQAAASAPAVGPAGATYYNTTTGIWWMSTGSQWIPAGPRMDQTSLPGGNVDMNGFRLIDMGDPQASNEAATKQYVDRDPFLTPIRLVSSGNLGLTGLAAIDGVTPIAGDRIGAFYQSTGSQNGIYVAASGAWARASDANTGASMAKGTRVRCTEGNQFSATEFTQINNYATVGTDTAVWRPFVKVDQVNAFIFPPPWGQGHLIYDTTTRTMRVWDGVGSWNMANGVLQAPSTGRPSGPSDGNILYETDSGLGYVYGSSAWNQMGAEVSVGSSAPTLSGYDLWVDTSASSVAVASGPLGTLGYTQITSGGSGMGLALSGWGDVTGLAVTVNVTSPGRLLKVTCQMQVMNTIANDRLQANIMEGATGLNLYNSVPYATASTTYSVVFHALVPSPSVGSHTYKVQIRRMTGTGTFDVWNSATYPTSLTVEDIGVA